ncbi:MAG: thiolase family protein [Gammaproteobacteria bacterium]
MQAEIPYGAYWSTPFARWQGAFAHLHSLRFAAHTARRALADRSIDPGVFDLAVLGITRPERGSFYGAPWFMGLLGSTAAGGPTVSQACATSVRTLSNAAAAVSLGDAARVLVVACDRTSNGPHIYYPNPLASGGTGESENFILDNMACDPLGPHPMIRTAENVATKYGVSKEEQHEVVLLREEQYRRACENSHAFHKRYMRLPFPIPDARMVKVHGQLEGDDGIRFSTSEGLAALKPVVEGGSVTFGAQTHPADGNAAMVVTTPDKAAELSQDPAIRIRLLGFGMSRAPLAYMPEAPIEAAKRALRAANRQLSDLSAINTHNPFAINDIVLSKAMGIPITDMNRFGCSLVFGHPNAPTGLRSTIELIEELVQRGGGAGLFTGCAAGDTAMALVLEVH